MTEPDLRTDIEREADEQAAAARTETISLETLNDEVEAERQAEMDALPYEEWRPPRISVIKCHAVLCPAVTCGCVGLRDSKEAAELLQREHRETHIQMNKKAALLLRKLREGGAELKPGRIGAHEVEIKTLDVLDKAEQAAPEVLHDFGHLDWQFGSFSSGRDPEKMWHRVCGGEVIVINHVRACMKCGRADTPDGRVPIIDFGEGTDADTTTASDGERSGAEDS